MAVVHSLVCLSVHLAHISVPLSVTSLAFSSATSTEARRIAAVKQAARETNVFIACPPKEKASARFPSLSALPRCGASRDHAPHIDNLKVVAGPDDATSCDPESPARVERSQ